MDAENSLANWFESDPTWRFIFELSSLLRTDHTLQGIGLLVMPLLLLVLLLSLPKEHRKTIWGPLILFGFHCALVIILLPIPQNWATYEPSSLIAYLLLLSALGRSIFILLQHVIFPSWGASLPKILYDILQIAIYAVAVIITFNQAGVELGSLLTTSALLTAVLGLSLQETLGNMFAGLSIQAQRPFEEGDWIEVDQRKNLSGKIVEINWRATRMITDDGVELVVPNGALAKVPIHNYTKPTPKTRRSIYIQAPYDVPPNRVRDVVVSALNDVSKILSVPAPSVVTHEYADSGIVYWCRFYCEHFEERWVIEGAARERIWYALHRAGISVPFPTRTTHLHVHDAHSEMAKQNEKIEKCRNALSNIDFFNSLPEEAITDLARRTEIRLHGKDETIIRQGDKGHELFVIYSGEVSVRVSKPGFRQNEVARLKTGEFFGEMSLMTGDARSATIVTLCDCELLVVSKENFQQTIQANSEVLESMTNILADRQGQLERQVHTPGTERNLPANASSILLNRIKNFFSLN